MFLLKLVAFLFMAYLVKADQEKYYPPEVVLDHPRRFDGQKGCYIPDLDQVIKRNKNYYPEGVCAKYSCYSTDEDDKIFAAKRYTCDDLKETDDCMIVAGAELSPGVRFPDCCDKLECK